MAYEFINIKKDPKSFYNNPDYMLGYKWARERLIEIERIANKYGSSPFQKYILVNVFDFNMPSKKDSWHVFEGNWDKKYIRHVMFVLKNSGSYTPLQLLTWRDYKSGYLKTPLDWTLEYASYVSNREEYLPKYKRAVGFYGMNPGEAEKRFETYHQKLKAKHIKYPAGAKK